jgi:predicted alpha/beta-hydrolase family hydrolase
MVSMARAVAERGIAVVTFNFLYSEARRRAPDRPDVLLGTWRAAIDAVRSRLEPERLAVGGKSMGGRMATMLAAEPDVAVERLVLLGYPLHPPGKPQQLRVAHLRKVRAPMLFVQGERDTFGTPAELRPHLEGLAAGTRLLVIEGGDHSLATPKKAGGSLEKTLARVAAEIASFTG